MNLTEEIAIYKSCSLFEVGMIAIAGFSVAIVLSILLSLLISGNALLFSIIVLLLTNPILFIIFLTSWLRKQKRNKPRGYYQKVFAYKAGMFKNIFYYSSYPKS